MQYVGVSGDCTNDNQPEVRKYYVLKVEINKQN
jgi:hypothetical protein